MILWFYGDKWSSETKASLLATQNAGSNTRKLCRLLKSFDYVYMIQQSLKKKNYIYASGIDHGNADINGTNEYGQVLTEHEEKLLNSMSIITQALWVLFMYYDNQIVLTRLKLFPQILGLDPKVPDRHSNKFWFAADMCTLGTACYRYYLYSSKYEARVSELKCKVHEGCTLSSNLDFHGELNELRRLHKKRKDSCIWQIMKVRIVQSYCVLLVLCFSRFLHKYVFECILLAIYMFYSFDAWIRTIHRLSWIVVCPVQWILFSLVRGFLDPI